MLATLHIQNIALIEDLTLNLGNGLNILSGETGAGKSIIIDSLNFVLGERADKTLIRNGTDRATVEAVFENYLSDDIKSVLDDYGIECEEVLIIRRSMTESKNEARVNGRTVTLSMLKSLSEKLVDIHGQHEHQSLLRVSTHISLLDAFGTDKIAYSLKKTRDKYTEYHTYLGEYKKYGDSETRERRLDILSYQIDELKKAELIEGEEDKLLSDRKKYRNAEKIVSAVKDSADLLNGGNDGYSVVSTLNKTINLLNLAADFDEELIPVSERIDSCKIEIRDIADTLSDLFSALRYDEYGAEKVEKRLTTVRIITRKYGGSVESANKYLSEAEKEYDMLINADALCAKLEKQIKTSAQELVDNSLSLSTMRKTLAVKFENDINTQLRELGMPSARFKVDFKDSNRAVLAADCTATGCDDIEFLISANKGEPLKPLAKIISGGEMSRFMLALKNITARLDNISTMVFDEIDTGISGVIAQVVAEKLYNISTDRQVIAVTHLPQLASMADLHYKIEKYETADKTVTSVTLLDNKGQISEIARLIGGSSYSEHAIPHAENMKEHAKIYKNKK